MSQSAAATPLPVGMVPRMSFTSRRFQLPDFADAGRVWVLDRVGQRFPHWQPAHVIGWLRGIVGQDDYFFVRTEHAVGLAQVIADRFLPGPVVKELFVVAEPVVDAGTQKKSVPAEHKAEAESIYADMCRWAMTHRTSEFHVSDAVWGPDSDVAPKEVINILKRAFGDDHVFKREVIVAKPTLR